jgi:hypothetical protein
VTPRGEAARVRRAWVAYCRDAAACSAGLGAARLVEAEARHAEGDRYGERDCLRGADLHNRHALAWLEAAFGDPPPDVPGELVFSDGTRSSWSEWDPPGSPFRRRRRAMREQERAKRAARAASGGAS